MASTFEITDGTTTIDLNASPYRIVTPNGASGLNAPGHSETLILTGKH